MAEPRESIARSLRRETVAWLSSVRPDGAPHVVPIWFVWDGESILVFSKPDAQKVRNLRADPRAMVAVGRPGADFDVELVEVTAEIVPESSPGLLPDGFVGKYASLARRAGIAMDRFAATYSQPIRLHPTRWLGWGGPGWAVADP
ncbi:MAG TPA: pyridoxamine 5'-phosphate oxidase family protein [Candidatus Limnocylindrales bacterium]|nr:pyridoxamine 5'-phosphate oxidase family protein [Candidatus Limnocylindrales bacterium]